MELFSIGQMVATPGALEILQAAGVSPLDLLARMIWRLIIMPWWMAAGFFLPMSCQARIRRSGSSQRQWVMMGKGPVHVF